MRMDAKKRYFLFFDKYYSLRLRLSACSSNIGTVHILRNQNLANLLKSEMDVISHFNQANGYTK